MVQNACRSRKRRTNVYLRTVHNTCGSKKSNMNVYVRYTVYACRYIGNEKSNVGCHNPTTLKHATSNTAEQYNQIVITCWFFCLFVLFCFVFCCLFIYLFFLFFAFSVANYNYFDYIYHFNYRLYQVWCRSIDSEETENNINWIRKICFNRLVLSNPLKVWKAIYFNQLRARSQISVYGLTEWDLGGQSAARGAGFCEQNLGMKCIPCVGTHLWITMAAKSTLSYCQIYLCEWKWLIFKTW